jgi:phospholipid/cholesterol/gamma-HCH transport system substrate-binding protein
MKRAIKTHATDFAAIIVLLVLSVVVAGYILNHEGLRFPFIESSPFTINAEFSTAQAVTPGQGQSVRVSGVQIGTVGGVTLKNGVAIVQMDIDSQYKGVIHQNWSALLRPKTGLKDMFIELSPGRGSSPVAKPGYTIPVANTLPDIDVDEILGSLDADSRAYLQLLINGAGEGLAGRGGSELAQVLERYEPTHRDLARVNGAIAVRGADLRQLVNSLQRLNTALATKQGQIVQLVDSSARVFRAFASEDGNISLAIKLLPATLSQTTATLQKVETFAKVLGPTATNLLPAAQALPSANAALVALAKPSTPIVSKQIRPFVIAAQPLVKQLQPAASNLAAATPNLSKTFNVINHLGNMLGYNPGNTEHGYLWWLAWLDHEVRTLFSIQDANGVFRPIFLQLSCASMTQVANGLAGSAVLLNLTPIMSDPALCPTQSTAGLPTLAKHPASSRSAKTDTPVASSPGASSSTTPSSTSQSASSSTSSGTTTSPNAASTSPNAASSATNGASSATNAANSALNSILKP